MKLVDLTGKKFGRLVVVKRSYATKRTAWLCICDCGNTKVVQSTHLKSGSTRSCGCLQKEQSSKANRLHGETQSSLYKRWKAIRQRCLNPSSSVYKNYGARGITICDEWNDFEKFRQWSLNNGYSKELELDRIDNSNGYFPNNCRWCSSVINNHNRRNTIKIDGLTLQEISNKIGLPYSKVHYIYYRIKSTKNNISITDIATYANQLPNKTEKS